MHHWLHWLQIQPEAKNQCPAQPLSSRAVRGGDEIPCCTLVEQHKKLISRGRRFKQLKATFVAS